MIVIGTRIVEMGKYTSESKSHVVELSERDLYFLEKVLDNYVNDSLTEQEHNDQILNELKEMISDY